MAHQLGQGGSAGGRRRRRAAALTAAAVALLTAACGGGSSGTKTATAPVGNGQTASSSGAAAAGDTPAGATSSSSSPAAPAMVLTANPADGTKGADPSKGIQISAAGGKLESVTATDAAGKAVAGAMAADGSSWSSSGTLAISSNYTVTAKGLDASGAEKTTTSKFTTLTPQKRLGLDHYMPDDGTTVGVGQPVSIVFTNAPNEKNRDAVEKAMTVTTTPHVDGAWSWVGAKQVDWRPKDYWQPGTKVQVHMGLNGVKAGDVTWGSYTKDFAFTIGDALVSTVDLAKDQMTVTKNGQVIKTIPVSGGEVPKHMTWSGKMVVLEKDSTLQMTSASVNFTDASDFYDLKVQDAVKLTDSGTFVHAAPWNEGKFGRVNGSHGCIGMSMSNADWFFSQVKIGDVVEVLKNSASKDNVTTNPNPGFDDWNLSWDQWLKGSATGVQAAQ